MVPPSEAARYHAALPLMRVLCSYCQQSLGTKEPYDDDGVTHSICEPCFAHFSPQWEGQPFAEYLNGFPFPVALVDGDVRVVAFNDAAQRQLGWAPPRTVGLLGGEALECARSRLPGGCGRTSHCATCALRNSVVRAHRDRELVTRLPITLELAGGPVQLLLTTSLAGELVRVSIEAPAEAPVPPEEGAG
jgi:hypothetical protein